MRCKHAVVVQGEGLLLFHCYILEGLVPVGMKYNYADLC
jgi:hypothetical protein